MNDIKKLITQNENRRLEFKKILPTSDKIIKTAIAFSNSQGGDLIIGVGNDNKFIGINEDDIIEYEENISNIIYDNCLPTIIPEIYSVRIRQKTILVIHFYPSNNKPHYIRNKGKHKGTFVRVGSSNRLANIDILESLEREKRRISFDSVLNYDLEFSEDIFDNITDELENKLNINLTKTNYKKLKLIKKERNKYFLTNLGVLFSKKRNNYFPLVKIECARFKESSTKVFLDQSTFDGNIIDSI